MVDSILNAILTGAQYFEKLLWGPWTLVFIAIVALFFTIKTGFFQFRKFGSIMKITFGRMFEKGESDRRRRLTPFQAATTSLAGTVGMGNIAGVALALTVGGPGAIFWMWLLALLGMILKTAEITLGVHYREVDKDGNFYGGPMYYIRKGLGWKPLAIAFSVGMILDALLSATLLQPHTVGRAFLKSYQLKPVYAYVVAAGMAVVTGLVVIGGLKRIGKFCERLVPLMSLIYILGGLIIIAVNIAEVPGIVVDIFSHALGLKSFAGGAAGTALLLAIKEGVAKGMFSSEAGQGSAPMAHAAAVTKHPFEQGIWGAFEVFIDTIIICTITALVVLSSGQLEAGETGIDLVITSFATVFPSDLAGILVTFSILTFCLTTQIGFYVYYETSIIDIFGKKPLPFFKWFYLVPGILFAGIDNVEQIWVFANITVGVAALPNLVAILFLSGAFFGLMKDYIEKQNRYDTANVDGTGRWIKEADTVISHPE